MSVQLNFYIHSSFSPYPVDFEKLAAVATGPIGPGDTAEVPVDLPALKVLGMYTVDADIKFDNGITVSKATKMDFTAAKWAAARSTP